MHRSSSLAQLAGQVVTVAILLGPFVQHARAENQSAGPSNAHPRNILWVTFADRLAKLRAEAETIDQYIMETLNAPIAADNSGLDKIEKAFERAIRLSVIASQLKVYGEPAAYDFEYRYLVLYRAVLDLAEQQLARSGMQKLIERRTNDRFTTNLKAAAKRVLSQTERLARTGKVVRAYDVLLTGKFPLHGKGIWWFVKTKRRHPDITAMDPMQITLSGQVQPLWIAEAQKAANEAKDSIQLDFSGLISRIEAAADSIAESGKVTTTEGVEGGGPAALEYFGNQWVAAQLAATKLHRYTSICQIVKTDGNPDMLRKTVASFSSQVGPALARIIQADTDRAGPDEASDLYFAYLKNIPPIVTRSHINGLAIQLAAPLENLLLKSPELAENVKAYRETTDDLLRWRERTTRAYALSRQQDYPAIGTLIIAAANKQDPVFSRPKRKRGQTTQPSMIFRLHKSTPEIIKDFEGVFVNRKIRVYDLLYSERTRHAVSRYQDRTFSFIGVDAGIMQDAAQFLARDLYVTDESPAPTLEAQLAVYSARQNDIVEAGGTIDRVGIVGWAVRYTTLSGDDRGLVRLGPLESESAPIIAKDMIALLLVRPSWLRTKHFFVAVPEAAPDEPKAAPVEEDEE